MNLNDQQLVRLVTLTSSLRNAKTQVADLESCLKNAKAEEARLETDLLPTLLDEFGVESLTLKDGAKVEVKPFYSATIPAEDGKGADPERRERCFAWLRDNGHGALIKDRVVHGVHPSTLKAWVKEQYEEGNQIPEEDFGVFVGRKAKLS